MKESKTLEHDRWWIDKKLSDVERFDQKQLQLIGLSMILLTLLSLDYSSLIFPNNVIFLFSVMLTLLLIGIYIFYSWPRKVKHPLGPSNKIIINEEAYSNYVQEIQVGLTIKAKIMFFSNIIFIINLTIILGLLVLK